MYEYGNIVKLRAAYLGWSFDHYVHRLESGRTVHNSEIRLDLIRHASHNLIPIIFKYAICIVQLDMYKSSIEDRYRPPNSFYTTLLRYMNLIIITS